MTTDTIDRSILIDAPVEKVWKTLTTPYRMKVWLSDTEVEVITTWQVGNPIIIRGILEGIRFENKGMVLQFEPLKVIRYSYLSSLSHLPDIPENYCHIGFRLEPEGSRTTLYLKVDNFPTETIKKHNEFYWRSTLMVLKNMIEDNKNHTPWAQQRKMEL